MCALMSLLHLCGALGVNIRASECLQSFHTCASQIRTGLFGFDPFDLHSLHLPHDKQKNDGSKR